jgi:hypothetical protein
MKAPSLTIYGHSFAVAASARAQTARFEKQKRSTKRRPMEDGHIAGTVGMEGVFAGNCGINW